MCNNLVRLLFLFCFALKYAIKRVQNSQDVLTPNRTRQLLACVDDVNVLGENIDTIQKNTVLLDAIKYVSLELNPEKTKYMLISHYQKTGQKHSVKTTN
jgi:hypothetical protein